MLLIFIFYFSQLRDELNVVRRRGMIRRAYVGAGGTVNGAGGSFSAGDRACGRCRTELGRIINRGAVCR